MTSIHIMALFALEVIKTHAQINQGGINATEQEVMHAIDQPSIYSNLVTHSKSMKRFVKRIGVDLFIIEYEEK